MRNELEGNSTIARSSASTETCTSLPAFLFSHAFSRRRDTNPRIHLLTLTLLSRKQPVAITTPTARRASQTPRADGTCKVEDPIERPFACRARTRGPPIDRNRRAILKKTPLLVSFAAAQSVFFQLFLHSRDPRNSPPPPPSVRGIDLVSHHHSRCGNDPFSAGGYGSTNQGDHVEGNPFSPSAYMVGGIGKVKLLGVSSAVTVTGEPAQNMLLVGQNTQFTKQFRGYSSYDTNGDPAGKNPFKLVVSVGGVEYTHLVHRVYSDTLLEVETHKVDITSFIPFSLGTPRGTGALSYGPSSSEVILPNSASKEQLTVVCTAGNDLPTSPTPGAGCKFTKELKVGYWLVLDFLDPPVTRVITSIKSDTELTVDADFTLRNATTQAGSDNSVALSHSGDALALANQWTFVACPPRVGKRGVGLGVIESHHDQTTDFKESGAIATQRTDASLTRASGAATLKKHRIVGRGTRFESQFGVETHWVKTQTGGYFGQGPWLTVQINGDWETVRVDALATSGTYAEYVLTLENSFSEPLLKATHFHWYTLLTQGYGKVRSYGKRVVSNSWSNVEFSLPGNAGIGRTEGVFGNTRFLTQLRTGFTITACGQTRMVNSIQSDVEMTIDRPFTLGNREFLPGTGSTATSDDLYVRGLTRLMPLWPRGVTVQLVVTSVVHTPKYKYHVWWKTFKHTDDGDDNAADDSCTETDITTGVDCGLTMKHDEWKQLEDKELQKEFGVYVKWNKCAMGGCASDSNTVRFAKFDQWKIHVADIENCEYWISTEGERFITDDNANPPVCYNYGKCLPITTDATTVAEAQRRPQLTAPGLVTYDLSAFKLMASQDPSDGNRNAEFTHDVTPGDIIRILVGGTGDPTAWKDIRVTRVLSNTELITDYAVAISGSANYRVLKCAAGRRLGDDHDERDDSTLAYANERGLGPDEHASAYLPHPELSHYSTWSYKYCEIDPGCCGFRVSSVVQPQQFGYYFVKPDHSNYNLRIAVHTVNDNLDLYTRRDDDGGGRPDTTNYHLTSVRESVPWAIDEDEYDFACVVSTLKESILGRDAWNSSVVVASDEDAYHSALGRWTQASGRPNCEKWVVGVMGDNRYPQTVGASEYSARYVLGLSQIPTLFYI